MRFVPVKSREQQASGVVFRARDLRLHQQHGLNRKTVRKWRGRDFVHDAPMGPKAPRSTVLTPEEEARRACSQAGSRSIVRPWTGAATNCACTPSVWAFLALVSNGALRRGGEHLLVLVVVVEGRDVQVQAVIEQRRLFADLIGPAHLARRRGLRGYKLRASTSSPRMSATNPGLCDCARPSYMAMAIDQLAVRAITRGVAPTWS
jgi:hypothetical protein